MERIKKPTTIALRVEPWMRAKLEQIAATEGRSLSDVVRRLLTRALGGERR